ncbi:MAG: DUF362 domain-containing protein [Candidatus Omnitrophota bacterium]
MTLPRVSIIKCSDYNEAEVFRALNAAIDSIGGIGRFVNKSSNKVFLKPNLGMVSSAQRAASTHPVIIKALGRMIKQTGAEVIVGDSPSGPYKADALKAAYKKSGLEDIALEAGIRLNYDLSFEEVFYPEGILIKKFNILKPILEADTLVSVPKLKTHVFMGLTGAVKNLFGVIPGLIKRGYHLRFQDADKFADMLLDIYSYLQPGLVVVDGIIGMEGDGPSWGNPRRLGLILVSDNCLAADMVLGYIMGFGPYQIPILENARKRKMLPLDIEHIDFKGISLKEAKIKEFVLPCFIRNQNQLKRMPEFARKCLRHYLSIKISVNITRCTGCGICRMLCPVMAIQIRNQKSQSKARINWQSCIRCYCCYEMCPQGAITLKRRFTYKIASRFNRTSRCKGRW